MTPQAQRIACVDIEPETVMAFKVKAGRVTYHGDFKVQNDDGTSTLPMMVHSLIKQLAESHPQIHNAQSMTITAALRAQLSAAQQRVEELEGELSNRITS